MTVTVSWRATPPGSVRSHLDRPRLLSVLAQRFEQRIVVLAAGPGFGKTDLLARAVSRNRQAPRGQDVWVSCTPADANVSSLCAVIGSALAADPETDDAADAAERISAAIWRRCPAEVAIVLDDVHLVAAGSPGARLIEDLVDRLPRNGHLVLAGRPPLPLPAGRLALRAAVHLGESDLAFDADELRSFAGLRGVPAETVVPSGGWPALAELAVAAGSPGVLDYLSSEILAGFTPDRRELLAAVSLVGGADAALLAELAGTDVDADALLGSLPLAARRSDGWYVLHRLWAPALVQELTPDVASRHRTTVAHHLRRLGTRSALDAAMQLLTEARSWSEVGELVRQVAIKTYPVVGADVITDWLSRLPPEVQGSPDGMLLRGLATKRDDLAGAARIFDDVAHRFHDAGVNAGEIAALGHLAHIRTWLIDPAGLGEVIARSAALDLTDQPEFAYMRRLGPIMLAVVANQPRAALEKLRSLPLMTGDLLAVADWLRAMALLALGEPEAALPYARRCRDNASGPLRSPATEVLVLVTWFSGRIADALAELPRLAELAEQPGLGHNVLVDRALCSCFYAAAGEVEAAATHLRAARSAAAVTADDDMGHTVLALAEATACVDALDERGAREILRRSIGLHPLNDPAVLRLHRLLLPLTYVLLPETRALWDETPAPGRLAEAVQLARMLVRLRVDPAQLAGAELPAAAVIRVLLPLAWAVELGVGLLAVDHPAGTDLVAGLPSVARRHLSHLLTTDPRLAPAARTALSVVARTPPSQLVVKVLGPLRLDRDGHQVLHPDLRRERVRQLLLFLVAHPRTSRAQVMDALWPDEPSVEVASRNLRVTLTYLQRVLEPDRVAEPHFVRADGARLVLAVGDGLELDSAAFDRLHDQAVAEDREGDPARAVELYRRALTLYQGPYLADVPYAAWADPDRHRYQRLFLGASVRAGELLLAGGTVREPLARAVEAIQVDETYEPAHRLLAAVHLARGDRSGARTALAYCRTILDGLGLPVEPATEVLARRIG